MILCADTQKAMDRCHHLHARNYIMARSELEFFSCHYCCERLLHLLLRRSHVYTTICAVVEPGRPTVGRSQKATRSWYSMGTSHVRLVFFQRASFTVSLLISQSKTLQAVRLCVYGDMTLTQRVGSHVIWDAGLMIQLIIRMSSANIGCDNHGHLVISNGTACWSLYVVVGA